MKKPKLLSEEINWDRTARAEFPFSARHNGQKMSVRINDFPAEPMYTLIVGESEIANFDDWPQAWTKRAKQSTKSVAQKASAARSFARAATPKRSAARSTAAGKAHRTHKTIARKSK